MEQRKRYASFSMIFVVLSFFLACTSTEEKEIINDPVDYVNPYLGNISHLLVPTFPTVHLPNSMLRMIPARADYTGDRLKGLSVVTTSHRGSSAFTISPVAGPYESLKPVYQYSYDREEVTPYSYQVYLDEAEIDVNYAVSHQSGMYRISFHGEGPKTLLINNRIGEISISEGSVAGYQVIGNDRRGLHTKVYLYMEADREAIKTGILEFGEIGTEQLAEGRNRCAVLQFAENEKEISIRYGVSFISAEQARRNLYREMNDFNLEKLIAKGRKTWNDALGKIRVEGANHDDKAVFYTSLYRTFERPICISEDGSYFSGFDHQIHEDEGISFYTDDWIWDTYRATHPLRVLIEKEMELDIIRSFIRMAEQMDNFWMPTFPEVTGDSRRMNSNHGVATVLDAYTKGIQDFDLEKAYNACKKAITEKTLAPWSGKPAGDVDAFYKEHGYFPALREDQVETSSVVHSFENRQAVAVTLGTVYDEWCLSEIANILDKKEDAEYFLKRSYNYRKLFNSETNFFHPKDDNNKFITPFDYRFSGGMGARRYYGENNAWVYRWDVPHNVKDLIELMGGRDSFVNNLEATFNYPLGRSKYAFYAQLPDHTGNVGQFSMANEPSLHIPYLYNYAGQPWRTQKRIRGLLKQWFRNDLMGVPGDEDGGGMSAFVAFSQLGFYPLTPGSATYTIGSPIFEKAEINLGNGGIFTIIANKVSNENKYIQSARLNGKVLNLPWFDHAEIHNGGILELEMGPLANKQWGNEP